MLVIGKQLLEVLKVVALRGHGISLQKQLGLALLRDVLAGFGVRRAQARVLNPSTVAVISLFGRVETRRNKHDSQFIGLKEHHRVSPLVATLAALSVVFADGSIGTVSADRTRVKQTLRKDLIIANDGRPWREAPETREIVFARLRVDLVDVRLPPVLLGLVLGDITRRLALRASSLLGRRGCSVGVRLGSGFGFSRVGGSGALFGFLRVSGTLGSWGLRSRLLLV